MDHLWAPWRMSYVTAPKTEESAGGCFICSGLAGTDDQRNLIVLRTDSSVVFLNRYPYNNGHLLIAPRRHEAELTNLQEHELLDSMRILQKTLRILSETMQPHGYNVGLNLGRVAGAGLPGHLHWHIVPRWMGDTNFMPVLSDTRVIVQSLDALYELLAPRLQS